MNNMRTNLGEIRLQTHNTINVRIKFLLVNNDGEICKQNYLKVCRAMMTVKKNI